MLHVKTTVLVLQLHGVRQLEALGLDTEDGTGGQQHKRHGASLWGKCVEILRTNGIQCKNKRDVLLQIIFYESHLVLHL